MKQAWSINRFFPQSDKEQAHCEQAGYEREQENGLEVFLGSIMEDQKQSSRKERAYDCAAVVHGPVKPVGHTPELGRR